MRRGPDCIIFERRLHDVRRHSAVDPGRLAGDLYEGLPRHLAYRRRNALQEVPEDVPFWPKHVDNAVAIDIDKEWRRMACIANLRQGNRRGKPVTRSEA